MQTAPRRWRPTRPASPTTEDAALRWMVTQGKWSYGASSFVDFLDKTAAYTIAPIVDRIQCPCLVMEAEADQFFLGQPQQVFDALRATKTMARFTSEDGAENHCQSGALAFKDQVVFDWLDGVLGRSG